MTPRVPEEGPIEHLKNALTMVIHFPLSGSGDPLEQERAEQHDALVAIGRRIKTALQQLENSHVYTGLSRRGNRRMVRRRNPALAILGNPRVVDADRVLWAKIEYVRPDDPDTEDGSGTDIVRVHEFPDGVDIGWLSDGSVQLSHPSRKLKLWMDDKND